MTTIRVKDYLDDEESDNLTASGAAFAERLAKRKRIDDTVRIKNTAILDKAQEGADGDAKEEGQ